MILTQCVLGLLVVASALAQNDLVVDCNVDKITIKWRPRLNWAQKLEPSKAHLGDCPPSCLSEREDVLVFSVRLTECGFRRQMMEDKVTYSNVLTYGLGPGLPPLVESVQCASDESDKSTDKEDLVFIMELMNSDFSGPASSAVFTLGSNIQVRAEVALRGTMPVQAFEVYLQRCVLATTPELTCASQQHTIISNSGCLTESKEGTAMFLQRRKPSEILLYFQAFKFALGENLFIHCDVAAWPQQSFNIDKKACHYSKEQQRWELLDDLYRSYICTCCDSTCILKTNSASGMTISKVLGPFTIVDGAQQNVSEQPQFWTAGAGESGVPVWVITLSVFLVLLVVSGALAIGYYLCFWRGGRVGYRPSRDLLTKY